VIIDTLYPAVLIRYADGNRAAVRIRKSANGIRQIHRLDLYALSVKYLFFVLCENFFYSHKRHLPLSFIRCISFQRFQCLPVCRFPACQTICTLTDNEHSCIGWAGKQQILLKNMIVIYL